MTDLSPTLSIILVETHSSKSLSTKTASISNSLNSFLKEAYQINRSISSLLGYLRGIRQPYLSTAPPPRRHQQHARGTSNALQIPAPEVPAYLDERQREDIDRQTTSVLQDINNNISNLTSAITIQHDTATKVLEKKYGKPNGVLWRWAAGDGDAPDAGKSSQQLQEEGGAKTTKSFRDGVIWYLNNGLEEAVRAHQEMMEIRLERERQKQMSVLYDKRNSGVRLSRESESMSRETNPYGGNSDLRGHDEYNAALDDSGFGYGAQELSPEQLQLFEEENRGLFEHYNDQLTKVTQAEKSLMEISSLQQTLVGHLSVQGEMIGQLVEDASNTDENVTKGNRELKRANERSSTAKGVFWGTVGLCSFLVVWDLIF